MPECKCIFRSVRIMGHLLPLETVRLKAHLCFGRHSLVRGKELILPTRVLPSGDKMKIRQADLSDAPVITEFNLRLAQETENLQLDPGRVAEGVAALLRDPSKGLYYLAEAEGMVAGQLMITYEWSDWRNGNLWWIQSVYVREEFRQKGVFRALFDHLQELAKKQSQVRALRLYMHSDNVRARRSYERLGMKQTKYEVFELDIPEP